MEAAYIFAADFDAAVCISRRKQRLKKTYKNIDEERLIIVVREIESWYLAGLDEKSSKELGLPFLRDTNDVKKEQFDHLIPKRFDSRIDFMLEILKHFSLEIAIQKNHSFKYFIEKYQ